METDNETFAGFYFKRNCFNNATLFMFRATRCYFKGYLANGKVLSFFFHLQKKNLLS